jgi:hypothetical protein
MGPIQPIIQRETGVLLSEVEQQDLHLMTQVKNAWSYTSTPPYVSWYDA